MGRQIIILDYGAGNLHSVRSAVLRACADNDVVQVSDDVAALKAASHIILPGVGAFGDCVRALRAKGELLDMLSRKVHEDKTPFLGICVGMQMMLDVGYEHGEHAGLGWIKGRVQPISADDTSLKIPHMGWNELRIAGNHPVLEGIENGDHAYFVHSFHACCDNPSDVLATVEYGGSMAAVIGREHIIGVQCHPEKSQKVGLKVLENFLILV